MKSPFAILLAAVVIVGIVIGVAAILLLGPSDQDEETIPAASRSELPTPSTRPASERTRPESETAPSETGETATDEPTGLDDDTESTEPVVVEVVVDEAPDQGGQRGFGGAGGPGGGNFQAIQEAMANNPELAELFQKAQSGSITQEEQARMRELMQELLAESGIEIPGGGQGGGGFGTSPTQGTISAISGSTITIDHNDDSGLSTDVEITDNTNISVISQLTPADLTEGTNVAGTVQRGEGGRIFIVNLTVVPEQQSGGFRGLFGASFPGGNDATNISNINGTIAEINEQTISVGTTQGTLRLTANEDSNIISTSPGSLSDITEGMAAIAFGGGQDNTPIQPRNLVVGPESLLVDN